MAIQITEECINCGACEPECPNNAIYEGGAEWSLSDGTSLKDDQKHQPLTEEFYYIVTEKCTECVEFNESPSCASVCPVDCCIPDPAQEESTEELLKKKEYLHTES